MIVPLVYAICAMVPVAATALLWPELMVRKYLLLIALLTFFGAFLAPIMVSTAYQLGWQEKIGSVLPGASALFAPPLVLACMAFVVLTAFYRRVIGIGVMAAAVGTALASAIAGFVASFPFLCMIARECL